LGNSRGQYTVRSQWRELSRPTSNESLVEAIVRICTAAVRSISPYRFLLGRQRLRGSRPGDVYVLAWWVVLTLLCVLASLSRAPWMAAPLLALSAARFIEIVSVQTGIIICDHKRRGHFFQSIERSVLLAFNNLGQTIVCLALAAAALSTLFPHDFVFSTDCHNSALGACDGFSAPTSVIDFIYMISGQFLTVGSKYSPVTSAAEAFHVVAVCSGLFLVALSIAFFVGGMMSVRPVEVEHEDASGVPLTSGPTVS